jgi:hypothetical protein
MARRSKKLTDRQTDRQTMPYHHTSAYKKDVEHANRVDLQYVPSKLGESVKDERTL